ncbi:MAG TPA: hypothetical protein VF794_25195, partial [Archangium sp.]|uniref:hypothetical protein n=1 Tax=Archangium sp. TaxID=1872627 RepID=UPI002ED88E5B
LAEFLHQQRQHAAKWKKQGESALNAIFKEGNPTIPSAEIEDYIWYRHLFLKRGKPATHLMALHDLPPETLRSAAPAPFGAMVELLQRMLTGTAG